MKTFHNIVNGVSYLCGIALLVHVLLDTNTLWDALIGFGAANGFIALALHDDRH